MNLSLYIEALLPEWLLLVGAGAVMMVGIGRGPGAGRFAGPLAVLVLVLALTGTWLIGPYAGQELPGLLLTPFVHYVRLAALAVGTLILLCNLHLPAAEERGEFFAMILFSLLGLLLTSAANDLLVLFFAIELVSVPTYVLVSLSREDARASEAGVKYFFLGAAAAALMVYGFSFLYGALGGHLQLMTTESGEGLSSAAAAVPVTQTYVVIGLLLSFAGIFFKLAAVPFHVYAPDVYEGAASPVTGLLGFLPKFAGLVAAVKLLAVFDWQMAPQVRWMLWIVSALTMTVGNTLALWQTNVKRMLAYSSIAHSGYLLIGLLVGPALGASLIEQGPLRDGVAAMLFYVVVYGAMNLGAFAVLAALTTTDGRPVEELADLEGLSIRRPGLALALAICCFSLMGFPPTAGLLAKVYIFSSAFSLGDRHPFGGPLVVLAVIGVINSAIGAAYYLRIVAACYLKPARADTVRSGGAALTWGIALCSLGMLVAFAWPTDITSRARAAAQSFQQAAAVARAALPPAAVR
jgi:NADH-quinone oxidoreductase subunit N